MNEISIFLANNYIWFIIVVILLLFALLGYFLDSKTKKKELEKTEILDTIKYEDKPQESLEELKEQMGDKVNKSLNSVVSSSDNTEVNNEKVDTLENVNNTLKEDVQEESTFQA